MSTLAAALATATGMVGAMFGHWLMDRMGIDHQLARGLAMGTISHGQGTAQAVTEGELQGAIAAVAMGLAAIVTTIVVPPIASAFLRGPAPRDNGREGGQIVRRWTSGGWMMEMARPRAIRPGERTEGPGPATPGMRREAAFVGGDRWVGHVQSEPGVKSGWHHHGDTDTYFYVISGSVELEFGPGGQDRLSAEAGDFVHVPRGLVHREGTTPDAPGEIILVRMGSGAPVFNVDGPEPA